MHLDNIYATICIFWIYVLLYCVFYENNQNLEIEKVQLYFSTMTNMDLNLHKLVDSRASYKRKAFNFIIQLASLLEL